MGYYIDKLSAERLKRVYEIAPPRVKQYLQAEIDFALDNMKGKELVLELGCGYGRILNQIAGKIGVICGIDNSFASLDLGREIMKEASNLVLAQMDAVNLAFHDNTFDTVLCLQNGISAFGMEQRRLIEESIRVTKPGGKAFLSTYSEKFWEHRLQWFQLQSAAGLLGEINWARTGKGVIICQDGFKATTLSPEDFRALLAGLQVDYRLIEVDESSLFCEIITKA